MITGQQEVPEDKSFSFVKYAVFGLLLIILPGVAIFNTIATGGAFIVPPESTRYIGTFPPEVINPTCVNLPDLFNNAAQTHCVPAALLMAISRMECGRAWGLDCNQIAKFSSDSWQEQVTADERNLDCCYNNWAGAMGPMQFIKSTWEGIVGKNPLDENAMNRCRIDLSFAAAAQKIKGNSGTTAENCNNWDEETVYNVARRYCGSCGSSACNENYPHPSEGDSCDGTACGVDYCGGVWLQYQQYANQ